MPITLKEDSFGYYYHGLPKDHAKYEKDIQTGKIPCPYTVRIVNPEGNIITNCPVKLNHNGESKLFPKFKLYRGK